MKKLIASAAIALTLATSCSQKSKESEVPKTILKTFNSNFKNTKVEKWDKEKDGGYEAEFDHNGIETSATFSADGKLRETEQEVEKSALPAGISDYVSKNHPGKDMQETAKITTSEGIVMYEVEIDKKDLMFDDKGNFIK
jgi:hypothetical protein